jgi:arabinofuranosyltransferase
LIALYAFVVLRTAWLCDDAYITYRTVDNFVAGLGLRWNLAERVQAFTHPLWMFLVAAGYGLSGNVYWTALGTSLVCSVAAVWLVAWHGAVSLGSASVAVLPLILSSAFVDYSTSGLENPLSHLLLASFGVLFLSRPLDARTLLLLSGIASLAALNRPDALLLYLPALAHALVRSGSWRGLALAAAGFAPLAAWGLFSLVYYGFPFPNTAYAKLGLYLPREEVLAQGLRYLENSLRLDPVTLLGVLAGGIAALAGGARSLALFAGAPLYVAYVVAIGGDFMAGRMLAAPLLLGALLLARAPVFARPRLALPALAALLALGLAAPNPSFLAGIRENVPREQLIEPSGIADERRYYEPFTALSSYAVHGGAPAHEWTLAGERARAAGVRLVQMSYTGFFGFAAGPGVHIVDLNALSDAFLARLPPPYRPDWRIGHVWRELPAGYWETLERGTNQLHDPGLARYYEAIARVTRGGLFEAARWGEIVALALGRYDGAIDVQRLRFPPVPRVEAGGVEASTALDWRGADVVLAAPSHARRVELEAGGDDAHALVYFRGARDLAITKHPAAGGTGLARLVAGVPRAVADAGFDRVRVMPYGGDGVYVLGGLRVEP